MSCIKIFPFSVSILQLHFFEMLSEERLVVSLEAVALLVEWAYWTNLSEKKCAIGMFAL